MTAVLPDFPDAELLAMAVLEQLDGLEPDEIGTRTPTDLDEQSSFLRVWRSGGGDDGVTDRPVMAFTAYAPTRPLAWKLARRAQQLLLAAGGTAHSYTEPDQTDPVTALIDRVVTFTGPLEDPDRNPDLRQATTYVVMEFRRPRR